MPMWRGQGSRVWEGGFAMYLRVSVTERCNLRCRYCLPEQACFPRELVAGDELRRLMALVVEAAGVHKIRFTGGEPALCRDLVGKQLVPTVGLTSNGTVLEPLLPALRAAGLDRLNISLDALDDAAFRRVTRRSGVRRVVDSLCSARRLGFRPLKLNCVAMRDSDFAGLVRFAVAHGVHLRFIELMAIGEARERHRDDFISAAAIRERLMRTGIRLEQACELDEPTSRVWRIGRVDEAHSTVGFITTVSNPFCGNCDRLRLTSQGRLYTCLFDARGSDLAGALRAGGDAEVRRVVREAVRGKRPPRQFERSGLMAAIGG